ncbi:MAG: hypothetical protein AVDCRST_MAG20-2459 [uncultured Acidimicrobiales bacterium]|uniref:Uncharacterized protein n=1 Tax=uncultured Acidimicrobiales bacterium TaxID=310071 RepID=A0A6J4IMB0_9ACTN|nr:MAG: hypothetical protein AVDCRST_MAG20-2459 [uncultured Acidimicrobiales bacterium]
MTAGPDRGAAAQPAGLLGRRGFVGGSLAAVTATAFAAGTRPWTSLVAVGDAPLAEQLGALLRDTPGVRAVGEAYLVSHEEHRDVPRLLAALAADLGIQPDGAPPADLGARAWEAVQADLLARRTVRLDGWVASPTEARLAAMTLLVHPS